MSSSATASLSESMGEDDSFEDITIEEAEAESSLSEEQQDLLTHPKGKSKCWWFFGFHTDSDGMMVDKNKTLCQLCSTSTYILLWKHDKFSVSY